MYSALVFVSLALLIIWVFNEIIESPKCRSKARLDGKVAIVTGCTSGIGECVAVDLARRGAKIIMPCFHPEKGHRYRDAIIRKTGNHNIVVYELDLSSQKSIREFARQINEREERIDILVHNAGIADPSVKKHLTVDGLELTMAVNHFGPFLLTHLLIDLLKKSAPSRIVVTSSLMYMLGNSNLNMHDANRGRPMISYCSSKYANVLFTQELARRLEGTGVTANCLHPGVVNTEIWDDKRNPSHYSSSTRLLGVLRKYSFKTAEQGAQTTIHVAVSDEVAGVSGKFFRECRESRTFGQKIPRVKTQTYWERTVEMVKLKPTDPKI